MEYASPIASSSVTAAAAVDDSDDDDVEDAAFTTAHDESMDQLESSRKISFSSPNVARVPFDEFISPIVSRWGDVVRFVVIWMIVRIPFACQVSCQTSCLHFNAHTHARKK